MKVKITLALTVFMASISISNATKYYVLNDSGQTIGTCKALKIEKDSENRFSRAVFSQCDDNLVFSYSRDFHYKESSYS